MKRNDYILALTSGFLTASENKLEQLFSEFEQRFELKQPAKPNSVSIGGRSVNNEETNFFEWIHSLRKEGIKSIDFIYQSLGSEDLPSHIIGAFAGVEEFLLQVSTATRIRTYSLKTIYSPQYEISAADFIELMEAQSFKKGLWERVVYYLQESNSLNNRPGFEGAKVKEYISNPEGRETFNFMLSQLVEEIQIECTVFNSKFIIPDKLQKFFYKSEFFSRGEFEKEIVYFYPVKEVTGKDLLLLAEAQPFSQEIWERCSEELNNYPDPDLPAMPASSLKEFIGGLSIDKSSSASNLVSRVIRDLCQDKNVKPIVPASVKECFGPDELEEKRARARSKGDKWYLTANQNPWELYFFEEVPNPSSVKAPRELLGIKKEYQNILKEASVFAEKIQSGFQEAFGLGACLLSENNLPDGNFDEGHWSDLAAALKEKGFTDIALNNLQPVFYIGHDFKKFGWSSSKIYGLCAFGISDVFGGMGSWNDIYAGDEQDKYQKISQTLFTTMKEFFGAQLAFR